MERLADKVVIVTGGTRGIGEAIVRGLVREGAKVIFGGRSVERGETIAKELGKDAVFVPLDVSHESDWERIVSMALSRFGKLTSLVNNAGVAYYSAVQDMTVAELDACYRTNQLGTLLGIKHVVGPMRRNGSGSIVNVGSVAANKGHVGVAGYAGTKAAIIGITRAAALELAAEQIRVNVVHPGYFVTDMLEQVTSGQAREVGAAMTPMKRAAEPDEIVGTIAYLLSDDSKFVTGSQLAVDGGYLAS
jgi:3alpha(or 20beta)-hydroxysteroid dehydrogenase